MTRWAWVMLVVAGACYRDEPVAAPRGIERGAAPVARTMAQLPVLDLRGADEYVLFEQVRAVYAAGGFAEEAKKIELVVDEHVMIPYAQQAAVVSRHFLGDGPAPREHVAAISHWLYRDRLPDRFDLADYRAFMTGLVCNAFAEAIAIARGTAWTAGAWAEQTRAIRFERACLADLVRARAAPADSVAAYARFDRILAGAAPIDPTMTEQAFEAAAGEIGDLAAMDPSRPHRKAAQIATVLAMLAHYRDEQAAATTTPTIGALAPELAK